MSYTYILLENGIEVKSGTAKQLANYVGMSYHGFMSCYYDHRLVNDRYLIKRLEMIEIKLERR